MTTEQRAQAEGMPFFRSIRYKFLVLLSVIIIVTGMALAGFGFLMVYQMRTQTVGEKMKANADILADLISRSVDMEMESFRIYFSKHEWKELLEKYNLKSSALTPGQLQEHFNSMDSIWAHASGKDDLNTRYLDVPASNELKDYAAAKTLITEIFLTDRYGGLVASSDKTTDFYQADEKWWQEAFAQGKGREIAEEVSWDESSGFFGVNLEIPVRDKQGGVAGVVKQVMDAEILFQPLQDYKSGKTGHAGLINENSDVISHPGMKPFSTKLYGRQILKELSKTSQGWAILFESEVHKESMFIAFSEVRSRFLQANGIHWYVFVSQSKKEVMEPLQRIGFLISGVVFLSILIFLLGGYLFANQVVQPIQKLREAALEIQRGNWDFHPEIRSGDEIQELAESFNYMVSRIHERQTELIRAKEEIEQLSKGLEQKVEERTMELSEAQRATLNILEDLSETNAKLTKYTEELEAAKRNLETQSWGLAKANDGIRELYKELEEKSLELEKLNRLKSDFVSIVAHEIRNPLTVIGGTASLLLDGLVGDMSPEQRVYLENIHKTGERLVHITNDLLDLAKIESGKIDLRFEKIDFLDLVRQAKESLEIRARAKGLVVAEDVPAGKLEVMADFEKMFQVFMNLMSNAVKFTEKGRIQVEVKDLGDKVRCAIDDTGPGISPEELPRLFSKFEQFGKPHQKGKEKGSGLGLVIARSIVEAHQGRLWAESEFGKGSRFIFEIPKQQGKRKLGQILVDEGMISKEKLDEFLRKQQEEKC